MSLYHTATGWRASTCSSAPTAVGPYWFIKVISSAVQMEKIGRKWDSNYYKSQSAKDSHQTEAFRPKQTLEAQWQNICYSFCTGWTQKLEDWAPAYILYSWLFVAPSPIVLSQQLVTIETFSFPCWHTSRHTNACVQLPAVDIFPVTELNSPSPFTTIFSHIFHLLSAFIYDSTSLCAVLTSPSTIPSSHSSCTHSDSSLLHLHPCPPPCAHYLYPGSIPFLHTTRNELGALEDWRVPVPTPEQPQAVSSHHRDSEIWNRWAQQVIDWQPTKATGALRTHCATKLKIPIRLGGFLVWC